MLHWYSQRSTSFWCRHIYSVHHGELRAHFLMVHKAGQYSLAKLEDKAARGWDTEASGKYGGNKYQDTVIFQALLCQYFWQHILLACLTCCLTYWPFNFSLCSLKDKLLDMPTNYCANKQPDPKPAASLSISSWHLYLPYLSRQKSALLCEARSH